LLTILTTTTTLGTVNILGQPIRKIHAAILNNQYRKSNLIDLEILKRMTGAKITIIVITLND